MSYLARVFFNNGLVKTATFNTPGKAIDYVIYWCEFGFPVIQGDVFKHTREGLPQCIYYIGAGI